MSDHPFPFGWRDGVAALRMRVTPQADRNKVVAIAGDPAEVKAALRGLLSEGED